MIIDREAINRELDSMICRRSSFHRVCRDTYAEIDKKIDNLLMQAVQEERWDDFSSYDWMRLLNSHPEYVDKCDWDSLDKETQDNLIRLFPDKIDDKILSRMGRYDYAELVADNPELIEHMNRFNMTGTCWQVILSKHPEMFDEVVKHKYDGSNKDTCGESLGIEGWTRDVWSNLLEVQPRFIDECPEKILSSFGAYTWVKILKAHPDLIEKFDVSLLNGERMGDIEVEFFLDLYPDLYDHLDRDKIVGHTWLALIKKDPKYLDVCNWDVFDEYTFESLVKIDYDYIRYVNLDKADDSIVNGIINATEAGSVAHLFANDRIYKINRNGVRGYDDDEDGELLQLLKAMDDEELAQIDPSRFNKTQIKLILSDLPLAFSLGIITVNVDYEKD